MTFSEIIRQNCDTASVRWWPRYAYHYTDVSNAVNILSTGYLYSRIKAQETKAMANDNASIQVINMTESAATSSVRFYFRPLTPTQYYNEGFKHEAIRYCNDENANVPVPVFFLFDLEKLLKEPLTKFSEFSQAGHSAPIFSGIDEFQKLDFNKIYSKGYVEEEVRKYRHAEILYPNSYQIDNSLKFVLCRSEIEKTTLMTLLKKKDSKSYYKYKNIIKVCKADMFENNGLFLKNVSFGMNSISFAFADTYLKSKYEQSQMFKLDCESLVPVSAEFQFKWVAGNGNSIAEISFEREIDYQNPEQIVFNKLPKYKGSKSMMVTLTLEGKLVCCIERAIDSLELL
ncbi:DarT ssDNA thymidine ADP-ribosyltransferase family protein [Faecalispora anaeroviscerum]|uniref:DarT ssDNA thymidine ADP-ribosyltransferase family protein n=1 Tax=Faecalispora anaeroviscerum TaxID=2991836 RepID=UPI0024B8D55C|nr:DarT ssDNA thymidine ADP-ribosyltransferase family protein [Faecalispora anaeroviscerum]